MHDARWVRRGKIAPWAPGVEDWEVCLILGRHLYSNNVKKEEERARKRLKLLLPPRERSPSPSIVLPHLRSPSPPITAPYPTPAAQHLSYTSFVMDKAVTSSYRSRLLDELENATNSLIEGEATVRRALGRLMQAMSEDPEQTLGSAVVVPKREDEGEVEDEGGRRLARAPDLTPVVHKLFLSATADRATPNYDGAPFAHPDIQLDSLEKSLASLRELQDDGREYVERLEEIRDGIGDVRIQRNGVWDMVRRKAIAELQEAAASSAACL